VPLGTAAGYNGPMRRLVLALVCLSGAAAAVPAGAAPGEPGDARLYLPLALVGHDPGTREPTFTPAPPTPTPTRRLDAGVPACGRTTGDAGGFRFSRDGGVTLAPNARRLANLAYTWDLDVDERDPDVILELHEGSVYRSTDAGCTFLRLSTPGGTGAWHDLVRAPSAPDLIVATSLDFPEVRVSTDGGATWEPEPVPEDVVRLAIDPEDPWRWTMAGRGPALYVRPSREARWEARPLALGEGQQIVSAAAAASVPGRWLVGTSSAGLFRTEDGGETWEPASAGLYGEIGQPPERVGAVVVVSVAFAPSDPDVAYAVVNRVAMQGGERGIWRTADAGRTWERRVVEGDKVGQTPATLTGGTRVFVSPLDPDRTFFVFGAAFGGYGTDLFRSADGLRTLATSHFDGFHDVFAIAFGPAATDVVFLGASSEIPPH